MYVLCTHMYLCINVLNMYVFIVFKLIVNLHIHMYACMYVFRYVFLGPFRCDVKNVKVYNQQRIPREFLM